MKLYQVTFFNSDYVGYFTNKKKAISFLRGCLKWDGEDEGYIFPFDLPFVGRTVIEVSGFDSNKLIKHLNQLTTEYIDERMDGIPPEPILTLAREDIRRVK